MLAFYTGHETLTFPDYLDLETGKTLTAGPREQPYDVAPASGRLVPDFPAGWFVPADPEAHAAKLAAEEAERAAAERGSESDGLAPDGPGEPGAEGGEPQQF